MATPPTPSIACIGVIGKQVNTLLFYVPRRTHSHQQDNPLHVALFPPHTANPSAQLDFSFILNSALDIFDLRARDKSRVDQDLGLLHAVDERLSVWGWETGTGTKFVIVLDMWGREGVEGTGLGIREAELKPVCLPTRTPSIKLLTALGLSRPADGVYQVVTESILYAG